MATKAQAFKASVELANQNANIQRGSQPAPYVEKSGVHHENKRAGAKAAVALEDHAEGTRPSRKSTRGASNHLKPDHAINIAASIEVDSPQSRYLVSAAHERGNVRARGG